MLSFFTLWAQGFLFFAVTVGVRQYTFFVNCIQLQCVLPISSTSKSLTIHNNLTLHICYTDYGVSHIRGPCYTINELLHLRRYTNVPLVCGEWTCMHYCPTELHRLQHSWIGSTVTGIACCAGQVQKQASDVMLQAAWWWQCHGNPPTNTAKRPNNLRGKCRMVDFQRHENVGKQKILWRDQDP